jgi:hypothetical protein
MSFHLHAYLGRTRDFTGTLYEADGTTELALAQDDVVRIKIGTNGDTPDLDLSNINETDNGSVVSGITAGQGDYTLRLAQGDLTAIGLGDFDVEINVVDESETAPPNAIKHAEYGVLTVHPTMGGSVAGEESSSSQGSSASSASSSQS